MYYTKIDDADAQKYGWLVAAVIAKIKQLPDQADGWKLLTNSFLVANGFATTESSASRLIKKLVSLGIAAKKLVRRGQSSVNHVKLIDVPCGTDLTVVEEKAVEEKQQKAVNEKTQDSKEIVAVKKEDVVQKTVARVVDPVLSFLKGEVIDKGIYHAFDSGEAVFVLSNGIDKPLKVSCRFSRQVAESCAKLGLDIKRDMCKT